MGRQIEAITETALTKQQLRVIGFLILEGPLRASELATALAVSPATTSGILERLETAGFVVRRTDPLDGRGRLIEATQRASETMATLIQAMRRTALEGAAAALTMDELRCLVVGLRGLLRVARTGTACEA
jgi:DNA-binding MarR family transcriptional regulator